MTVHVRGACFIGSGFLEGLEFIRVTPHTLFLCSQICMYVAPFILSTPCVHIGADNFLSMYKPSLSRLLGEKS